MSLCEWDFFFPDGLLVHMNKERGISNIYGTIFISILYLSLKNRVLFLCVLLEDGLN